MDGRCDKHLFEVAEDDCGKCGNEFCAECLVYSFGPERPPFCIPCAVSAAGIRTTAARRPVPRKEARRREREWHSMFRRGHRDQPVAATAPEREPGYRPMPSFFDDEPDYGTDRMVS